MVITLAKLRMAHASTHGARKPLGPKKRREERKTVITMAKLRMAHASTNGVRKPPGPKIIMVIGFICSQLLKLVSGLHHLNVLSIKVLLPVALQVALLIVVVGGRGALMFWRVFGCTEPVVSSLLMSPHNAALLDL